MKTILVPTDGSITAEKALDLALDLAEKHNADVKLMHVLLHDKEPDELLRLPELAADEHIAGELAKLLAAPKTERPIAEVMNAPGLPDRPTPDALLQEIGARVLERARACARQRGIGAETLPISDGPAAPAITAAAETVSADTIVMGMRGLRQIDMITFGSVSQEVCRSVNCTCVAVH